ncbi:hypothetical protein SARC_07211 [Sphaeroforma arctica JP610]|uniref:Mitochondrial import inner membrane translocase subunit Tim21 n=1 Tax=Sphaeroforma arctica JP610 TaxID=667725 RepID=A0A0L0FWT8_9EUKA|nr:hypothetical protein SARC_07211 [Sphaeroforma arctica JP610]KNC80423.1 hypothetical protein SARC_07211 [Sphaeroforma arctica JP610]|eukprot:XP_014154325.1 hypothetical protein SARC_07211 [Sphaeroforma arctica JP610]
MLNLLRTRTFPALSSVALNPLAYRAFSTTTTSNVTALALKHGVKLRAQARRCFHSNNKIMSAEKSGAKAKGKEQPKTREMMDYKNRAAGEITTARKVVEAGRDLTYLGVIIFGVGLTGVFAYSVFGELFGGSTPNALYSTSVKRIRADERAKTLLGDSIKAYGEETRRGRRRHLTSQEYEVEGEVYLRMRFYVEGERNEGTVHLEVKKKGRTGFEWRYLMIEIPGNGLPSEFVVMEDNR